MSNLSVSGKHRERLVGLLLSLLLLLTRSGIARSHFGSEFSLPDASWAVFWMLGAFTANRWWPALLMIACVAIDYVVIAGGVSAYCFTPAYPFLIPAYLSLWFMGRISHASMAVSLRNLPRIALSLLSGVSSCFVISNIGFYLAAGYFAQMPALQYAQAVAQYAPHYLLYSALYAGVGVALRYAFSRYAPTLSEGAQYG